MSRFIQQDFSKTKKDPKPRTMPKAGKYSVKDITADGVKKTSQEKSNG